MDLKEIVAQIHHYEKVMYGELDKLWYFDQNESLPSVVEESVPTDLGDLTIYELIQLQKNNRAYISRYKSKIEAKEEVARRTDENEVVSRMLKSLGTYNELTK